MKYDFKLYVHGVPMGQKTWGIEEIDNNYIGTFYGRKFNTFPNMLVETRSNASSSYCYYTYIPTGNTQDVNGRSGGYIALTLRVNYYYDDIQNVYNLLDAAYNKFIIGTIVEVKGNVVRYIKDFSKGNDTLKALEEQINIYMFQFSSDSDFISLAGFKTDANQKQLSLNVIECRSVDVKSYVRDGYSISVSPLYMSVRERSAKEAVQKEVATAKQEKDAAIAAVRNEYKNANVTIEALRSELAATKQEIEKLNRDLEIQLGEIKKCRGYKNKYQNIKKELEDKNAILAQIQTCVVNVNKVVPGAKIEHRISDDSMKTGFSWIRFIRGILPLVNFAIVFALLVLAIVMCVKNSRESKDDNGNDSGHTTEQILNKPTGENEGVPTVLNQDGQYVNAKIDVEGLSGDMDKGKAYKVTLKGVDDKLNGTWFSEDFDIACDYSIKARHAGKCTISYIVGNDTLNKKEINVK